MQTLTYSQAVQLALQHIQNAHYAQAEPLLRRLIQLQAEDANTLHLLAVTLLRQQRPLEALPLANQASALRPQDMAILNTLGAAYLDNGQAAQAESCYRRVLTANQQDAGAHFNLGLALIEQKQARAAVQCFQRATQLNPNFVQAYYWLGQAWFNLGEMAKAQPFLEKTLALNPQYAKAYSRLLLALTCLEQVKAEDIYQRAKAFDKHCAVLQRPGFNVSQRDKNMQRRLKIGYLSSDLRAHSVAYFMLNTLAHHNHEEVEVYCYHSHKNEDEISERLRSHADHWVNCATWDDATLSEKIYSDQIDILIELNGHTVGSRLLSLIRRPAPIQASYLGYPGTTGLSCMQYRLTDNHTDPLGQSEAVSSETLVRLPGSYFCYQPHASAQQMPVQAPPSLQTGYICFGSFNNYAKLCDNTLWLWAEILHDQPDSRLLLKCQAMNDLELRQDCLARFAALGISAERLELHGYAESIEAHLDLYAKVDIALDSLVYNGATTTCEALWMGVPVISLSGETHASRMTRSILHAANLSDWVAETPAEFRSKVLELSQDPQHLATLRSQMRTHLQASPLMDGAGFTQRLEATYRRLWEEYCCSEISI